MALTLTPRSMGYEQAYNLLNAVGANASVVGYVTIGRQTAWANDAAPPDATDTDQTIAQAYNALLGGKIVTGSDVALVIPRLNWITGTVYTAYDDQSTTLFTSTNSMYILTATSEVYKCIDNANNAPSTVQPSTAYVVNNGFSSALGDGYVWKYLYKVPAGSKFLTTDWMPIPSDQNASYTGTANNAVDGAISRLILVSGGSSYLSNSTNVVVTGGGVAANVTATVTGGVVTALTLVNRGSGYNHTLLNVSVFGVGTGANVRVIGSPYRGHAFNPARELGANACMVAVQIGATGDATEGGKITSNNEFRQIGLLLRPHKYGVNTTVVSANANVVFSFLTQVILTAGSAYTVDELVYQGTDSGANATFTGYVTETFSNAINISTIRGVPKVGGAMIGATSGTNRVVVTTTPPELDRESGSLVYLENRVPITRSAGHAETIKLVVKF
jgi:hypothetical protein